MTTSSTAVTLILLALSLTVAADQKTDFQQAYRSYKQYMDVNDKQLALGAAADAYKLGSRIYGKSNTNTAKLAINYATLLNDTRQYKKAKKVLKGKLKIMEEAYGSDGGDLVSLLIELGRAHLDLRNPATGIGYFERASSILDDNENVLIKGLRNFDIVSILLKRRANTHTRPFVQTSYASYKEALQSNDVRLGLAAYHMAMFAINDDNHDDAVEYLNESLNAFESDEGEVGDVERTVRTLLVDILERSNKSEDATEQCLAIGERQEWRTPPKPLYMVPPALDKSLAKEPPTGRIVLSFTVDEQGFVRSPRVSSSTAPGLNEAALAAVGQFRYAPRFEDGVPVATSKVNFTVNYDFGETPSAGGKNKFSMPPARGSKSGGTGSGVRDFGDFGGGGGK